MPYVGRDLQRGNYLKLDDISSSFDGSTTTFNLQSGGSAFYPGSAFSIFVSVGGVVQEPESAYTINKNTITFANAPHNVDECFITALGVALGVGVPGHGTVNGSQLAKPFNYDGGLLYLDSANDRVGVGITTPTHTLDVNGTANFSGNVTIGGTLTYQDVASIDAVGIATFQDDVNFNGTGAGISSSYWDKSANEFKFKDNVKLSFGDDRDLQLQHNNSDSVISHISGATGNLKILSGGAQSIECVKAGAVNIAHNGNTKLTTTSTGATLNGVLTTTQLNVTNGITANLSTNGYDIKFGDSTSTIAFRNRARFGVGEDLQLFHNGSHSYIQNSTGSLLVEGSSVVLRSLSQENYVVGTLNGSVDLYYDSSKKFETTSAGTLTQGDIVVTDAVYLSNASTISSRLTLNSENASSWQGTRELVALDLIGNGADHRTGTLSIKIKKAPTDSSPTEMMRLDGVNNLTTFYTVGSERLRITSDGKVGIGTDNPVGGASSGMFEIYNSAHAKNRVAITVNEAQNNAGRIDFKAATGTFSSTNVQASVEGIITNSSGALTGDLVFHTNAGDSLTEKLRILANGHLLLGTSTDYADNNSDDVQIYGTGHTGMSITSGSSNYGSIYFGDGTSGDARNEGIVRYNHSNNSMELWTNRSEKLRINSNGDMGLGLTASYSGIFGGSQRTFQIGGTAAPCLRITPSTSNQADLVIHAGNSGRRADIANITANGAISMWTKPSSGSIAERIKISADGYVTKPNQPSFRAHDSNHAQTGFLTFDQIATNVGNHYSGSNGRFTAPVAGTYFFSFYGMLASSSGNARVEYYINGSVHSSGEHYGGVAYTNGTTYNMITCNTVLTLNANDYVNLNWNASYNSMHSYHNGFMGFLIG